MSDHIRQTIADVQNRLRSQEQDVLETKRFLNKLAEMAQMPRFYSDAELQVTSAPTLAIRSDMFYGQPLATAVRKVLDLRKASDQGPASINEVYDALIEGGFAFETKNPINAKRNLRISVTKNTAMFHKLPNGRIGLVDWYPSVKGSRPPKQTAATAEDFETDGGDEGGDDQ